MRKSGFWQWILLKLHGIRYLRKGLWEGTDIPALARTGGTDLCDVTICLPLSNARIRHPVQTSLNILRAAWSGKVSSYAGIFQEAGGRVQLLPVPISTLCGWHPDAHRALCFVATTIAARGMPTFISAKSIVFLRHCNRLRAVDR